jgi:hypothetical protein
MTVTFCIALGFWQVPQVLKWLKVNLTSFVTVTFSIAFKLSNGYLHNVFAKFAEIFMQVWQGECHFSILTHFGILASSASVEMVESEFNKFCEFCK